MGYNNGYEAGYADAIEDVRNGRVSVDGSGFAPEAAERPPVVTLVNGDPAFDRPIVGLYRVEFYGRNLAAATLKVSYSDGQGGTEEHAISISTAGRTDDYFQTSADWYQEAGLSSLATVVFTVTNAYGSVSVPSSFQPE